MYLLGPKMSKYFILIFLAFFSLQVHSAIILKVKGRKALVDLEGVKAERGDKFDALNLYGKPLGVLEIKKVKRGKAIAVLLKGKMGVSWILEPAAESSKAAFNENEEEEYDPTDKEAGASSDRDRDVYTRSSGSSGFSKTAITSGGIGALGGLHFNSLAVSDNKSISGMSFKGALFADFTFVGPLGMRLIAGYHSFIATGKNCGMSTCNLLIHYPGAGFLLRGVFLKHLIFQPWIGGGGFLLWPLVDKQHNLGLSKKSFESFHGIITAAGGIDIHFNGFYIPIQFDINWTNLLVLSLSAVREGSTQFKPFYIGAKIGIAFSF